MTAPKSIVPFVTAATLAVFSVPPIAARAADFYAGKTITFIASDDAGGGYDTYTRLLVRHIAKYIPGAPTIVVQNEPGAGGLRAAQVTYGVAEKDGTKIGNFRASNILDAITGIRGADIDPRKYQWIGNMTTDTDLCVFWRTSGVKSFADLMSKEVLIGAAGTGSVGYSFAHAINYVLHTKMKIIPGYKGTGDRMMAMQQGEIQGGCGLNGSTVSAIYVQQLASGDLVPIMQNGLRPYSAFPDVPLTQSFATTDAAKHVLTTIFSEEDIARIFAAPPGTPPDRVEILRNAFNEAMRDPELIDEAKKMRLDLDPMSGEELAKIVAAMADISDDFKAELRAALGS